MAKNLVIVESPAKARTLASFLGSDYEVESTFGHLRDLPKKELGVDLEKNFEPKYEISPDKKQVAAKLKKAAKGKVVWLASDEDREGEAIAWHVCYILGLEPGKTNRIVFHEITKTAVMKAIEKPRHIDANLVDAQQARRVLDRLVGYELSPVLWKKVRAGLSAGRVQSVAVRLIVEREREISAHEAESSFKLTGSFKTKKGTLEAELDEKLADGAAAEKFLEHCSSSKFEVANLEQKPGKRTPSPPFTTSTLQQEASRKLGYSVRQTMVLAQKLYENGHITYMRTDSTHLSELAISAASKYIIKNYGEKYADSRQYKTRTQGAQEAHEAIRPSNFSTTKAGRDSQQQKLYGLIWRRTVASQMAAAVIERTDIQISISNSKRLFLSRGEVLHFDGFFKVYGGSKDDQILPEVSVGEKLDLSEAIATEGYSRSQPRYSEASLVRKLEELGIGRPSTYAPTIGTIQDRGYIEKKDIEGEEKLVQQIRLSGGKLSKQEMPVVVGADRNKLIPTQLADIVTDFLMKYFASVIDYDFTARAEDNFDDIAEGKNRWQETIKDFYEHFHPLIDKSSSASRKETLQVRELGKDPSSGQLVIVRYGRFGPVLQMGDTPERKDKEAPKPKFAPLPEGFGLDNVTLDAALPMFNLPREVGKTTDGLEIIADVGRYGPYIKVGSEYTSIKGHDPLHISEEEARRLLSEKVKKDKEKQIADFGKIKILKGPYGPYVTDGKSNARIPKNIDGAKLSEAEATEILKKKKAKANK